ncbi:MAG: hypothetical protein GY730_12090 [bacterium]|nr:hypothetical protein [bacterium]
MVSKKAKNENQALLIEETKENQKKTEAKQSTAKKETAKQPEPKKQEKQELSPKDKTIETDGQPRGANPICVHEKARITAFSGKLSECKTVYQALNKSNDDIKKAEDKYIQAYYDLGQKIHEAKQVYHAENNKKLSDQAFTDLFNDTYSKKDLTISRPTVQRAKKLIELWERLDRTQRLCLIRGENWIDSIKYARNKLQEENTQKQEQAQPVENKTYTPDLLIKGIDAFDVFSQVLGVCRS